MNANGGFTRSYRRKWDNPVFANKQQAAVWAWMCDVAQWQPTVIGTKWGPIDLRRGELVIAERVIAEDFGMHRNTMRGLLNRMVDEGMIRLIRDRIPHRCGTIVSIVKYAEYQGINGARYEHEDRTSENSGPYAGPHEDRIRTENNTVNYQEEIRGSLCETSESPPHVQAPARESGTQVAAPVSAKIITLDDARGPAVPLPDGWLLPDEWRAWAEQAGQRGIDAAARRFFDHWFEMGAAKTADGWRRAWERWIGQNIERGYGHGRKSHNGKSNRGNGLTAYVYAEYGGGAGDAEDDPHDGGRRLVRG